MSEEKDRFGHTELPPEVSEAVTRSKRLEWLTIGWLVITVTMVMAVMGSSQAMKAAWIEDMLSFLPPIAFLLAMRHAKKKPDEKHRFGFHRSIGAGHLAASVALLGMGGFLTYDSAMTLIKQEHPTIGTVQLFGSTVWLGWLMIATLVITSIPTVVMGRMKLQLAPRLHDKILFADADMNKADWQTAAGGCLGVLGIGLGWWWADSVVAILIALSIIRDGVSNVTAATRGLLDHQAMTHDDKELLPLIDQVERYANQLEGVDEPWVRMRDEGHVMHTEVFLKTTREFTRDEIGRITEDIRSLDWKLQDTLVLPVAEFPHVAAEG